MSKVTREYVVEAMGFARSEKGAYTLALMHLDGLDVGRITPDQVSAVASMVRDGRMSRQGGVLALATPLV